MLGGEKWVEWATGRVEDQARSDRHVFPPVFPKRSDEAFLLANGKHKSLFKLAKLFVIALPEERHLRVRMLYDLIQNLLDCFGEFSAPAAWFGHGNIVMANDRSRDGAELLAGGAPFCFRQEDQPVR